MMLLSSATCIFLFSNVFWALLLFLDSLGSWAIDEGAIAPFAFCEKT